MKLDSILRTIIAEQGFVNTAQFINLCLFFPELGYYAKQNPIRKDFITSPEITDAFGKIFASYIVEHVLQSSNGKKVNIVEYGPGSGTFMKDIAGFIARFASITGKVDIDAFNFILIEKSPVLQEVQKDTLKHLNDCQFIFESDIVGFLELAARKQDEVFVFISNEFFDALPVETIVYDNGEWKHIVVVYRDGRLEFANAGKALLPHWYDGQNFANGNIIEVPYDGIDILEKSLDIVKKNGGLLLAVDYGYIEPHFKQTLQGLCNGKHSSIFENIGDTDITHLVDFSLFQRIAQSKGMQSGVFSQGEFLIQNGILHFENEESKFAICRITKEMDNFKVFVCRE